MLLDSDKNVLTFASNNMLQWNGGFVLLSTMYAVWNLHWIPGAFLTVLKWKSVLSITPFSFGFTLFPSPVTAIVELVVYTVAY